MKLKSSVVLLFFSLVMLSSSFSARASSYLEEAPMERIRISAPNLPDGSVTVSYQKSVRSDASYFPPMSLPTKFEMEGRISLPVEPDRNVTCEFRQVNENVSIGSVSTATGECAFSDPHRIRVVSKVFAKRTNGSEQMRCANYHLVLEFQPVDAYGTPQEPFVVSHDLIKEACAVSIRR